MLKLDLIQTDKHSIIIWTGKNLRFLRRTNLIKKLVGKHRMKNTLEYKILKYLSDNNNGRFINVSEIKINTDFLKSAIKDLKERNLIETEKYPGTPWKGGAIGMTPSEKPEKCKIKLSGIEYLDNLEKSIIDFRLKKWQIKTFWPIFILAIIGSILSINNFISSLKASKNTDKLEQRIEKMESELEKSQTSISNQKNFDSSHTTKVLTNKKGIE
ncbi:MAG TPA: hypothetical protein DER05_11710 [Lutibacter sp.]|nr:hypothetical protein [Lutibacter sp.]